MTEVEEKEYPSEAIIAAVLRKLTADILIWGEGSPLGRDLQVMMDALDLADERSRDLALEVLAARARLGEHLWTFKDIHEPVLLALEKQGCVSVMHGVAEGSVRASLTDDGKKLVLSPSYVPSTPRIDLADAILRRRCNGCSLPAKEWGAVCSGMTQGDYTHFHSPEWWAARAQEES